MIYFSLFYFEHIFVGVENDMVTLQFLAEFTQF